MWISTTQQTFNNGTIQGPSHTFSCGGFDSQRRNQTGPGHVLSFVVRFQKMLLGLTGLGCRSRVVKLADREHASFDGPCVSKWLRWTLHGSHYCLQPCEAQKTPWLKDRTRRAHLFSQSSCTLMQGSQNEPPKSIPIFGNRVTKGGCSKC